MTTTHTRTQVEAIRSMTNKEMVTTILDLIARVEKLEASTTKTTSSTGKEMTDDDARNILFGDLANTKHKDAAATIGLTYGQIYSCRLGYTFKNIHKEGKDTGKTNPWMK